MVCVNHILLVATGCIVDGQVTGLLLALMPVTALQLLSGHTIAIGEPHMTSTLPVVDVSRAKTCFARLMRPEHFVALLADIGLLLGSAAALGLSYLLVPMWAVWHCRASCRNCDRAWMILCPVLRGQCIRMLDAVVGGIRVFKGHAQ